MRLQWLSPFCLFLLSLLAPCTAVSQLPMPAPWQQAKFERGFDPRKSFPTIANGYLVSYLRVTAGPHEISLNALGEPKLTTVPFSVSAGNSRLEDVSVGADKTLHISGNALLSNGLHMNFIAHVDFEGRILSIKDSGNYLAERICTAGDGTLWTFGQVFAHEAPNSPDYDMLREYDADGSVKQSFLPRSGVRPKHDTFRRMLDFRADHDGSTPAFLNCNADSVSVYLGAGPSWNEVDLRSKTFRSWQVAHISATRVMDLVALPGHKVYASIVNYKDASPTLSVYQLSFSKESTLAWSAMPGSKGSRLVGNDSSSLVYKHVGEPSLYWVKP